MLLQLCGLFKALILPSRFDSPFGILPMQEHHAVHQEDPPAAGGDRPGGALRTLLAVLWTAPCPEHLFGRVRAVGGRQTQA